MNQEYIPIENVAEKLGVKLFTVRLAIRNGELDAWQFGKAYMTTKEAVDRYVESKKVKPLVAVK